MRLFERALARSRLPVKFTEGFNPRPRLSLPLPRAVGVASVDELLVVQMREPIQCSDVVGRLSEQMVDGVKLVDVWTLAPGDAIQPGQAAYELVLSPERIGPVADAVERLLAAQRWEIQRQGAGKKGCKTVDVKAYLSQASLEGDVLRWVTRITSTGSVRPAEILEAVGLEPSSWLHRIRRTWVDWKAQSADRSGDEPIQSNGEHG